MLTVGDRLLSRDQYTEPSSGNSPEVDSSVQKRRPLETEGGTGPEERRRHETALCQSLGEAHGERTRWGQKDEEE